MGIPSPDVNRINCGYFSRGTQLKLHKEKFVDLLPPENILFPKYIKEGDAVLDLGCGAGRTTPHIQRLTEKVIGVDLSEILIGTAKEKYPAIDFRAMDACSMDFPDDTFEVVVFSYNGLCYLYPEEKRLAAIREIHRVLKNDGCFIFSSFNRFLPLALHALVNTMVTSLCMGFSSKYKIHITRYGITVNYETSPSEEIDLLNRMGFQLLEQVPMTEKVNHFGYRPAVLTYYAFRKSSNEKHSKKHFATEKSVSRLPSSG